MSSDVNFQVLAEFIVPVELNVLITQFWSDSAWYAKFLEEQLGDLKVIVGEWEESGNTNEITREITSDHPSKITFPGLPSHAHSRKVQTIQVFDDEKKMIIREINSFTGIPYADYFSVIVEWFVFDVDNGDSSVCDIKVMLGFKFHKSTWLSGTIESNTRAELRNVYELWLEGAMKHLQTLSQNDSKGVFNSLHSGSSATSLISRESFILNSEYKTSSIIKSAQNSNAPDKFLSKGNVALTSYNTNDKGTVLKNPSKVQLVSAYSYTDHDDDDLEFFDCEEDRSLLGPYAASSSNLYENNVSSNIKRVDKSNLATSRFDVEEGGGGSIISSNNEENHENPSSSRDIAVNLVEIFFVMIEFSFWRLYQVYAYDLKELFNISPSDVMRRIMFSFVPGFHGQLMQYPDLYGPIIAVFIMPQVFLLCLEASEQGCDRSDLLGNAVVVSLCLWVGLSSLYRLLSFVIAPTIELKQCLCMTGYSFFSWSGAMLLSYPLEVYEEYFNLPIALPLVIFGLPSALALAATFWEQTPSSSITLRPASLHSSIQLCAQYNSRVLQRLLWAVPKIVAFVLVALTHYQFLWYVARIFLPGRKAACRLSAILQPDKYTDILSQKELRDFAAGLIHHRARTKQTVS